MILLPSTTLGQLRAALEILLRASDYATESKGDRWQFAAPLADILGSGATVTDLRWLIHRGFAEHAKETTIPGDPKRSFRPLAVTSFPSDTCLILTPAGAAEIRTAIVAAQQEQQGNQNGAAAHNGNGVEAEVAHPRPEWDAERRELRFAGQLIKRYRVPAHSQALVLTAFQEMSWPRVIDDPLPPDGDHDPKQRLSTTIKSLNRNRLVRSIEFHGNGDGRHIGWQAVACDRSRQRPRSRGRKPR
jgi:hypothetical protein